MSLQVKAVNLHLVALSEKLSFSPACILTARQPRPVCSRGRRDGAELGVVRSVEQEQAETIIAALKCGSVVVSNPSYRAAQKEYDDDDDVFNSKHWRYASCLEH